MPHFLKATIPSSSVVIEVVVPLCVMDSVAGYFHLWRTLWFLKALVIVARLRRHCNVRLERSGSSLIVVYCGGMLSGLCDSCTVGFVPLRDNNELLISWSSLREKSGFRDPVNSVHYKVLCC